MKEYILQSLYDTKKASLSFKDSNIDFRNNLIVKIAQGLKENELEILKENQKDLELLGATHQLYDRLMLNSKRIDGMIQSCNELIQIQDPLRKFDGDGNLSNPSNLLIKKVGTPLGVVACIYESRPNVTIDLTIMAIKSGNGIVLKGSSTASNTNDYLISMIQNILHKNGIDKNLVCKFPYEREYLQYLYNATGLVDVIIPRGGKQLIQAVKKDSLIPIIETGAGVVHLYVDDLNKSNIDNAINVISNAKKSRPSVCNALDTLLIKQSQDEEFYNKLALSMDGVQICCLGKDYLTFSKYFNNLDIIDYQDFHEETLSLKLHLKIVEDVKEAVDNIRIYSSLHSDGILSDNNSNIEYFLQKLDSSVLYVNSSTRFSDGGCFGLGGEIGISTQKLHARGPMGAEALVTYKYVVEGNWDCR